MINSVTAGLVEETIPYPPRSADLTKLIFVELPEAPYNINYPTVNQVINTYQTILTKKLTFMFVI